MTNVANTTMTTTNGGVTVTNGSYSATLNNADEKKAKEIYMEVHPQVKYPLLWDAVPLDVGRVVCEAGHMHRAKEHVPEGCTAVGILGKVTSIGNGLILALHFAKSQKGSTIKTWETITTFAETTLSILPDDDARGGLKSYTKLGDFEVSNWAVGQRWDYEAIFTNLGCKRYDKVVDENVNDFITKAGGSAFGEREWMWSATFDGDYAAFLHNEFGWFQYELWGDLEVRPVMGFTGHNPEHDFRRGGLIISSSR